MFQAFLPRTGNGGRGSMEAARQRSALWCFPKRPRRKEAVPGRPGGISPPPLYPHTMAPVFYNSPPLIPEEKLPMRSACTRLLRHGWRTVLSRRSAFTVGALAFLCCFGWTARSLAGTCTPPVIDGNIDDLKTYAACIGANRQGCGLQGTDL